MKKLNFQDLGDTHQVMWPSDPDCVDLNLPALRVFKDFMLHKPYVVNVNAKAVDVEAAMLREHVALKLVVDEAETFLGVIALEDLSSEEIMKKVADGFDRHELRVADFMKPRRALLSLDYAELQRASLGDVIVSLQAEGQQHCLVIDRNQQSVRGVISASEVARRVKLPLTVQRQSSFVDIFHAVRAVHH